MEKDEKPTNSNGADVKEISEGLATIWTKGAVFYNPVQEFNRDLSIAVISSFIHDYKQEIKITKKGEAGTEDYKVTILEALSATGLRSIRYAKEIPGVAKVIANDISLTAVEDIKQNVIKNNVEQIVSARHCDASMLMYQHRHKNEQFDIIDLDPYGCPSQFLDSTVQAVKEGGLLLITATDMAILCGNSPETCYSKYGAIPIKIKSCHEMAVRILLQCIELHANRYSRYIVPLLSLSADFYIRVFVRVFSGAQKCKFSATKLSHIYHCTGCDSFTLQLLVTVKSDKSNHKFSIPTGPLVSKHCEQCKHPHHIGGPIWSAPIHSPEFVKKVLDNVPSSLKTYKRIEGILNVVLEELVDVPLYYTLDKLSGTLHVEMPSMMALRSALLNAGYHVSFTHMNKTSIKTDAPKKVVWDIMRCWARTHPVAQKRLIQGTPAFNILSIEPEKDYSFKIHPHANPESRKKGFLRFQENPTPHWGPGCRATIMVGEQKIQKSVRNQGKRKRETSEEGVDK
ncbi:unnamed protein product [Acanthoscelides obtectus]|uniref:tRNA (guanine(26)-N(2))-dimethyltransferase n=1 Tax=Acanthoscelides obtectus TaxID=200917 RepID=A0A9P0Q4P4_ACAOB|nr:unnamed protein product [Acanthoscelides obtectus]CAK1676933.1 Probable tRNA (guanine(26)-N(2))-dimethyltransferase [Acanthoscelides obtectus]